MEIVEGKERPKEKGKDKYHEYGNTWRLILRLFPPLFMTGKVTCSIRIEKNESVLICIDQ